MNRFLMSAKKEDARGYGQLILICPPSAPPFTASLEFADMAISNGCDALTAPVLLPEVHVPWMMGATEQITDSKGLHGLSTDNCWDMIGALRERYPQLPIMAGSFPGDLLGMGVEYFADKCVKLGVDALDAPGYSYILNDPDFTGAGRGHKLLEENDIGMIQQVSCELAVAPEGTRECELLKKILKASIGFVLLMTDSGGKSGATGALNIPRMKAACDRVKALQRELGNEVPVISVCGIASPQNGNECVHQAGTDGALLSSAIIRKQLAGETSEQIGAFIREMKESLKR